MGIVIENEFSVDAAPDDVYTLLVDVERVAPCIPGAEVLGRRDDGIYDAKATVKLGPMALTYKGTAEITEADPAARRAVLRAKGADQKGQGTAQALMTMVVTPEGSGSHVAMSSDILVSGRVAQMGRGIMQDVAGRMIGEMARALEATLKTGQPVQARTPNALGLVAGSMFRRKDD
jgi:carbon monoxide dehydrogenase subunit G